MKIVSLENDNDHYINKIRENDAKIEDLNLKLESALEENILLQTDYENYKNASDEQLIRKEEELKEAKNEILNKEKIINRLNKKEKEINKEKEIDKEKEIPKEKEKEVKKKRKFQKKKMQI